jgi:hypothetical protein
MDMLLSVSHSLVIGQFYKEIFKLQIVCVCMCVCVCVCVCMCVQAQSLSILFISILLGVPST